MGQLHGVGEGSMHAIIDDRLELLTRLLVRQMRQESLVHLGQKFLSLLLRHILDTGVDHEGHQVHDQVAIVAEIQERVDSLRDELTIAGGRQSTKTEYHWLVDSNGRHPDALLWRVLAQNVAEVEMPHLAVVDEHQVLEMPVADSK